VHQFSAALSDSGETGGLAPGQRARVSVDVENLLSPGRYYLHQGVARSRNRNDVALWAPQVLGFVVFGDQKSAGVVIPEHEMQVTTEVGETE
jgi:hypothetical protein